MAEKQKIRLTPVSVFHYFRLVYRSILCIGAIVLYILGLVHKRSLILDSIEQMPALVAIIWLVFVVEMILRFFPSKLESPGSQKQFRQNYIKTGKTDLRTQDNNSTMLVAFIWICFNAVFGVLYMLDVFDDAFMIMMCCVYSVCDMICILFFCPFQSWFLKNKCCSSCRIYNWDYAMMFTPLFFIKNLYAWSLLGLSLLLMLRWEVTFYRYPERFSPHTNEYLSCKNCTEKLCTHKKQLKSLWVKIAELTAERVKFLSK